MNAKILKTDKAACPGLCLVITRSFHFKAAKMLIKSMIKRKIPTSVPQKTGATKANFKPE